MIEYRISIGIVANCADIRPVISVSELHNIIIIAVYH